MDLKQVFENNERFVQTKLQGDQNYFSELAKGQAPDILYIGCADSRVTAEQAMGAEPGEVFVMRNVANMVINTDLSASSVVNYAVDHLKVKHAVVCGHYGCGGVKAGMGSTDLGILNPYLREVRDVYRLHKDELNGIADEDKRYRRLVELNVHEQVTNLLKMTEVQRAVSEGRLQVHGWVFDLATGKLTDLGIDTDAIQQELGSIYAVG